MGGNQSSNQTGERPSEAEILNAPLPQLQPAVESLRVNNGKSITCSGWVCEKGGRMWFPDNVDIRENIVVPVPGPNQVRIKMYAAGVNAADSRRTVVKSNRESISPGSSRHPQHTIEFPHVCGIDGAGVVESVYESSQGEGDLKVGDRVIFLGDIAHAGGGSFCEYAVIDSDLVCKLPETTVPGDPIIDLVEAGAIPEVGIAAYLALFDKLRIQKGQSIFISGASGGVGTVAVQLARFYGLYVFASCSTPNMSYVKSELGADVVLDYKDNNLIKKILNETNGYGVDFVLECGSPGLAEDHSQALRFGGSVCVVGGVSMPSCDLSFRRQYTLHYVNVNAMHQNAYARTQIKSILEILVQLYLKKGFRFPALDEVPFERGRDAMNFVSQGHIKGKLVITGFHKNEIKEEIMRRKAVRLYLYGH